MTGQDCSTKEVHSLRVGLGIVTTLLIIVVIAVCIGCICGRKLLNRNNYRRIEERPNDDDHN